MAGFNRVIMMGNLTRDPEHKQLASGQTVCRLGLASNRSYRNRQSGDLVQEVCYVDVDVWGPQAEACRQYLAKGRPVLIEGRLKLDSWQDQEGNNRSKHSIVADRVVFLSTASAALSDETAHDVAETAAKDQDTLLEAAQTLAGKKTRTKKDDGFAGATKPKKSQREDAAPSGEIALPDDPPFQDDQLPF